MSYDWSVRGSSGPSYRHDHQNLDNKLPPSVLVVCSPPKLFGCHRRRKQSPLQHLVVFVNHRLGQVSMQVNSVLMIFSLLSPIESPILHAAYLPKLRNMVYLSFSRDEMADMIE
jgi:hypothetical protein